MTGPSPFTPEQEDRISEIVREVVDEMAEEELQELLRSVPLRDGDAKPVEPVTTQSRSSWVDLDR